MSVPDHDTSLASSCSSDSLIEDSIKDEAKQIADLVAKLKNFKPEATATPVKRNRGRPKKASLEQKSLTVDNPTGSGTNHTSELPSIILILEKICTFNELFIKRLDFLRGENRLLKEETNRISSSTSNYPPVTHTDYHTSSSTKAETANKFDQIDTRLDQIEQDKLSNIIKVEGERCDEIIGEFAASGEADALFNLDSHLFSAIDIIGDSTLVKEDILNVSVVGRNKKHLRVTVSNNSAKIKIHTLLRKQSKPVLFSSDYLTRARSKLAYDLRTLKRSNPEKIKSAYVFNGNVCCKLTNSTKFLHINTAAAYTSLVDKLSQ